MVRPDVLQQNIDKWNREAEIKKEVDRAMKEKEKEKSQYQECTPVVKFFSYQIDSDGHDNEVINVQATIKKIKKYILKHELINVQVVQILDKGLLLVAE